MVWGETADPDSDGSVTVMEYAPGTDPNLKEGEAGAMSIVVDENIQIIFRMRAADPNLNFALEATSDLSAITWDSDAFEEVGDREFLIQRTRSMS